jgi:hypothetical protein
MDEGGSIVLRLSKSMLIGRMDVCAVLCCDGGVRGFCVCVQTSKIGSLTDVESSQDADGLKIFYFLVQDLRCFVFSLINLHFKARICSANALSPCAVLIVPLCADCECVRRSNRFKRWRAGERINQWSGAISVRLSDRLR